MSAAWPSGSERCFYDSHDRKIDGSTPTQASLLRLGIRCFTTIIFAGWNLTSSKLKKSNKIQAENSETRATPKRVWIRPMRSASVASSCQEDENKEIKVMKFDINYLVVT